MALANANERGRSSGLIFLGMQEKQDRPEIVGVSKQRYEDEIFDLWVEFDRINKRLDHLSKPWWKRLYIWMKWRLPWL